MKISLSVIQDEIKNELKNILNYWAEECIDEHHNGFIGQIDSKNRKNHQADKGAVLNARILWSFSAGYIYNPNQKYKICAERAYLYIKDHFIDYENGGVYWTVDYIGNKSQTKKQIYAIAFTIYALAEYSKAFNSNEALQLAIELYTTVEKKAFDNLHGGYLEAFDERWNIIEDVRLSDKDENLCKTMNTHLHILEAYTNLYIIYPNSELRYKIEHLIELFSTKILSPNNNYLNLFFEKDWTVVSNKISYGHDIETAWLILDSAEKIRNKNSIQRCKKITLNLAKNCLEAIFEDGALIYEYDINKNLHNEEKHWWVQAESMVGFLEAYIITNERKNLQAFINNWTYIKKYIIDADNGEWYWGMDKNNYKLIEDKVGLWKCPYHNTRSCLEVIRRITTISNS